MITLTKGQAINLEKSAGRSLTQITMGLGWDVRKSKGFFGFGGGGGDIDLDASCLMFDASGRAVDTVWFRQLKSKCGSIRHTGDNLTGAGDGDDEQIIVDLSRIPAAIATLVFTVSSFRGDTFDRIENAYCRIVDGGTNREIARYNLSGSGSHTGQIMALLTRKGGEWEMKAVGDRAAGRTFHDMLPQIEAMI